MSTSVGSIHYDLNLDTSKFEKAAAGVSGKLKNIGSSMQSVGTKMSAFVTLPIVAGATVAIKSASDLNETINKVDVAFKKDAQTVKDWSKTTIKSFGIAGSTAMEAASLFGDMGTSMGLSTKEASKMSMSLTGLAGDLASFKNIGIDQAQTALAAIFTGETESLKRLGIVMTQTNLERFAASKGIEKNIKDMTEAEKVQLRYAYVMEKTKNAQGDFARTSEGTANQMRMFGEQMKELGEQFGLILLPYVNKAIGFLSDLVKKFQDLSPNAKKFILIVLGIAAVIGPLLLILGTLISSVGTIITLFASPVFWAVAAVIAVISAAVFAAWKYWEKFKAAIDLVVEGFKEFWISVEPMRAWLAEQFKTAIDQVKQAWRDMYEALKPHIPMLKELAKHLLVLVGVIVGVVFAAILGFILLLVKIFAKLSQFSAAIFKAASNVGSAIQKMRQWFYNLFQTIDRYVAAARRVIYSIGSAVFGAYYSVRNAINGIINWFRSLPGRIRGALGNLGGLLWNAGVSIIQGLYNGIAAKFNEVKNFVSGIASWIANNKGPIEKDRTLLINQGQAIMEGFNKGLMTGYKDVQKTIRGVNGDLQGNVGNGGMSASTTVNGNIIIGNKQDADYFMERITRSSQLAAMGLAG